MGSSAASERSPVSSALTISSEAYRALSQAIDTPEEKIGSTKRAASPSSIQPLPTKRSIL